MKSELPQNMSIKIGDGTVFALMSWPFDDLLWSACEVTSPYLIKLSVCPAGCALPCPQISIKGVIHYTTQGLGFALWISGLEMMHKCFSQFFTNIVHTFLWNGFFRGQTPRFMSDIRQEGTR